MGKRFPVHKLIILLHLKKCHTIIPGNSNLVPRLLLPGFRDRDKSGQGFSRDDAVECRDYIRKVCVTEKYGRRVCAFRVATQHSSGVNAGATKMRIQQMCAYYTIASSRSSHAGTHADCSRCHKSASCAAVDRLGDRRSGWPVA